jgi:hypothetical protein
MGSGRTPPQCRDDRRLEPAMTNDPKDRHVLAAAVAADS